MKLKYLVAALAMVGAASAQAAPVAATKLTVEGGTFFMGGVTPAAVPFSFVNAGFGDAAVPQLDLTAGYLGTAAENAPWPAGIVGFTFFGNPVTTYTALSNHGSANNAAGTIGGGPVPTAMVDVGAGTIQADMSALIVNWNGNEFNQGAPVAVGTFTAGTNTYAMSWSSLIVGGSFNGFTGTWNFVGHATPVPEASTFGMMGVGLGLVGLVARRQAKRGKRIG